MNKIKLFLFSMAIIVIASTSFMGIAMAAQVTGINKSKGHVHINGGVNDGFIPGATVCFFVSSVSYGNEFVCGSVVSAEASIATVKVPKSRAKKMKMGTEAMLHVRKEAKEEVKVTQKETEKIKIETKAMHKVEENAKEETKQKEDWFR